MNKSKLVELLTQSSIEDLAKIFDEIYYGYDWLMQYTAETLGIEEIEYEEDESDEEYEERIKGTSYEICQLFVNKCTAENTAKIVQLAIENDKVVELWDLFLGEEYVDDYDSFIDTFYLDNYDNPNFTDTQLKIVEEAIKYLREDIE